MILIHILAYNLGIYIAQLVIVIITFWCKEFKTKKTSINLDNSPSISFNILDYIRFS